MWLFLMYLLLLFEFSLMNKFSPPLSLSPKVIATAVLAYPAAKAKVGHNFSEWHLTLCLAGNIVLQIMGSLAGNLFATWFGPVSIVGPLFYGAEMVANLVLFGVVLGLENFTKEMQIGTYQIVVAVTLLVRVGPGTQTDQDLVSLMSKPLALVWTMLLLIFMLACTIFITPFIDIAKLNMRRRFAVLLIVRATAFTLNLTASRGLIGIGESENSHTWLMTALVIKIVSGAIYTKAIVVQSTVVDQRNFVPLNAVLTLVINAVTGLIVWEDWRVVQDWTGYVCVFLLFLLGSSLLLGDLQLLSETDPKTFRSQYSMMHTKGRKKLFDNIKRYGSIVVVPKDRPILYMSDEEDEGSVEIPARTDDYLGVATGGSMFSATSNSASSNKEDAWKSVFGMDDEYLTDKLEAQSNARCAARRRSDFNKSRLMNIQHEDVHDHTIL
jgi:hypothetical protein